MPRASGACVAVVFISLVCLSCERRPADGGGGELTVPAGFEVTVFADELGRGRHVTVRENGDVYVSLQRKHDKGGGIVALRDRDGDGRADLVRYFGDVAGTGIDIAGDHLYFAEPTRVVRFSFGGAGELVPSGGMSVVVDGFPEQEGHADKPITLDGRGNLYVGIGVPSNACQEDFRTPGSPGRRPCPELAGRGIHVYEGMKLDQRHPVDGRQYATGLRQTVALEWNRDADHLYLVMHGRDQLSMLFPEYYSDADNAELPGEEMHLVTQGLDAGWPYTYWDGRRHARLIAPEYGGDGKRQAEPDRYAEPLVVYPAHWAPNDLIFYTPKRWSGGFAKTGRPFPERYHGGAFVAFHGSWNRAPLPQQGYKVVFQPFDGSTPSGDREDFATGFAGHAPVASPRDARYRPCGVAVGPDGALFVVDSRRGRVWRIAYAGAAGNTD